MSKEIVILIGGPGTGKSTLIAALVAQGYCCYPEISREVTLEAQKQGVEQLFLEQPLLFSELLLEGRKKQFLDAQKEPHSMVFMDRGLPDVLAYLNYIGTDYPKEFDSLCKEFRYSKVFILPPWPEIYVQDQARYENFQQALQIQEHLITTYQTYGYQLLEVPKDTVDNRILFILDRI
ncbi:AAA family ATPase [Flavobacterium crassostreae]|uniref:ATPase n=1 Tax=Flavobacterium crassostreae TaxID=1763534 RepID=A0A1B9E7M0_9FLAO|nr:ATP-binding protein [Flavobacterium crassostreae]OCB77933.1 ATPase [Flavobacterium crassostreae]